MSSLLRSLSRQAARDKGKIAPHPHTHEGESVMSQWNLTFPGHPAIEMTLKPWEFALALFFWCLLITPQVLGWVLWGWPESIYRGWRS